MVKVEKVMVVSDVIIFDDDFMIICNGKMLNSSSVLNIGVHMVYFALKLKGGGPKKKEENDLGLEEMAEFSDEGMIYMKNEDNLIDKISELYESEGVDWYEFKGFVYVGDNDKRDLVVKRAIEELMMNDCTVAKFYLWQNIRRFMCDDDEDDFGDYELFVKMFIYLIEKCYVKGFNWPFEKLFMNHKKLMELDWKPADVEWFFSEHVRRGRRLRKMYKPYFNWEEYFEAKGKIKKRSEELKMLKENNIMPRRQTEIKQERKKLKELIENADLNWYFEGEFKFENTCLLVIEENKEYGTLKLL
jgi:hypothetical protein